MKQLTAEQQPEATAAAYNAAVVQCTPAANRSPGAVVPCALLQGWKTVLVLSLAALVSGCGYDTYEQRLQESQQYFAYVQRVDNSVAAPWKNTPILPGPVEQLRVPLQFKEIKKPPLVKDPETEKMVEPEIDPRQPDYLELKLPGLVGTWEAPLKTASSDGVVNRKGYLYILTNAYMFSSADESRRAPDFTRDLLVMLAEKLSVPPLDPITDSIREQYPRTAPFYVPQKTFDVYRIADAFVNDGAPYSIEIYVTRAGPIEVAAMLVLPVGVESSERLSERRPYMLETLKISSRPPAAAVGAPGATGGAGGKPAAAF